MIVSDDHTLPYERPPLSKEYLGHDGDGRPTLVKPENWYAEHQVTVRLNTRATRIDPGAKRIELSSSEKLEYTKLLLATGVRARSLPHVTSDRVLTLRSLSDATRIRQLLAKVDTVAILGGGFIGCEAASTAISMGKRVTIVERSSTLMEAALGATLGGVMTDVHRAAGVHVMTGCVVHNIEQTPTSLVVRTDRRVIEADLVLVGAGSQPNIDLAEEAGLRTNGGIVTDEYSRTSAVDIYAAGDVASILHPFYGAHLRVEHHDTAMHHGASAAKNMLDLNEPFSESHWFWSDQYTHNLQQAGRSEPGDEVIVRGSLDDLDFSAFSLRGARITKVISLNRPRDVLATRRLLFSEHQASPDQLKDESTPLNRLVPRERPNRVEA
ncbi:3-phenylpropionate/trans-cinnamate dioxygenase ferredoxin reductase subunit [Kribbella aluminosa]|uniref:3-phenylpropionate/trans-cinnamate dioxygenase ferredoxin reductase subunit n=1 Tax=Kribbella aluminosa TaxID=416017 RepID=A0ABS4UJD0_9ACTN|nr:3-phenylpropionate/trans-cinnamate dioxygenase ferredoxin reductase subunit [Kribbella aluminosa]